MLVAALLPALLALEGFPEPTARPPAAAPPAPSMPAAPTGATETHWYGWESLLTDTLSMTLLVGGQMPLAVRVAGAAGLIGGVPLVHLANGNSGGAIASLAVRGGVVLLAGGIAASSGRSCREGDELCQAGKTVDRFEDAGIAVGLLLGGLIFAVIDDTVLSRVSVPATPRAPPPPPGYSSQLRLQRLSAMVTPTRDGLSVGLSAVF